MVIHIYLCRCSIVQQCRLITEELEGSWSFYFSLRSFLVDIVNFRHEANNVGNLVSAFCKNLLLKAYIVSSHTDIIVDTKSRGFY